MFVEILILEPLSQSSSFLDYFFSQSDTVSVCFEQRNEGELVSVEVGEGFSGGLELGLEFELVPEREGELLKEEELTNL